MAFKTTHLFRWYLDKWQNTGFKVYTGSRILPRHEKSIENLACYNICASFSQERMTYGRENGKVEDRSKDGNETKVFDALEWVAAMSIVAKPCEDGCSHVPNKGEQTARYYGYYSNVAHGKRKRPAKTVRFPVSLSRCQCPA